MAVSTYARHWHLEEFLHAWEAGAFQERVELVNGEVLAVSIGSWHGDTASEVTRALPNSRFKVSSSSLIAGHSIPDPDCWVRAKTAEPIAQVSRRILEWASKDVLLVVEVSDETRDYDLTVKAKLYARAGFEHYWVVTRDGIYAHEQPSRTGYEQRIVFRRGSQIPVPYVDGVSLEVSELIAAPDE